MYTDAEENETLRAILKKKQMEIEDLNFWLQEMTEKYVQTKKVSSLTKGKRFI